MGSVYLSKAARSPRRELPPGCALQRRTAAPRPCIGVVAKIYILSSASGYSRSGAVGKGLRRTRMPLGGRKARNFFCGIKILRGPRDRKTEIIPRNKGKKLRSFFFSYLFSSFGHPECQKVMRTHTSALHKRFCKSGTPCAPYLRTSIQIKTPKSKNRILRKKF